MERKNSWQVGSLVRNKRDGNLYTIVNINDDGYLPTIVKMKCVSSGSCLSYWLFYMDKEYDNLGIHKKGLDILWNRK